MNKIKFAGGIAALAVAGYLLWSPLSSLIGGVAGGAAGGLMGGGVPAPVAGVVSLTYQPTYPFSGRLRASEEAEVRPQVGGMIEQIHFQEGDVVAVGQPLFTLDLRTYRANAAQARAALEQAKQAYERGVTLRAEDAISAADLEARKAAWQSAEAAAMQARVALDHAVVKAPIAGKIGRAEVRIGNVVNAGPGAPLLTTIQQLDPMFADFETGEQTYLDLLQNFAGAALSLNGAPVEVTLANSGATSISGTLISTDNRLNDASGSLRLRATVANPSGTMLPGLFARVTLTVPQQQQAVAVNDKVINTDQANRFVWKLDAEGKATYQQVTPGPLVDGLRVVTSGLTATDRVVAGNFYMLRPGVPVQPIPADMRTLQPLAAAPGASSAQQAAE